MQPRTLHFRILTGADVVYPDDPDGLYLRLGTVPILQVIAVGGSETRPTAEEIASQFEGYVIDQIGTLPAPLPPPIQGQESENFRRIAAGYFLSVVLRPATYPPIELLGGSRRP